MLCHLGGRRALARFSLQHPKTQVLHLSIGSLARSNQQSTSRLRASLNNMDGLHRVWIDCDAGVDDVQGLLLASHQPGCMLTGVSCVHGNTDVEQVARNVCRTLTLCGRTDIPVYTGCGVPLVAPEREPNYWFGRDGLGDAPHVRPPSSSVEVRASPGHAAVKLVECAKEHEGELTVIALGPLTNIAMACRLDPSFPSRIRRLVVMGSSEAVGNVTPTAEFNFQQDPEGAQVVLQQFSSCVATGHPAVLVMVSWELTERYPIPWDTVDRWLAKETSKSRFMAAISESTLSNIKSGKKVPQGWECADPIAVALAVDPNIITGTKQVYCQVELQGSALTRGMAVYDWNGVLKKQPNVHLVTGIDMQAYLNMMERSLE